jgi:hypothetical protein
MNPRFMCCMVTIAAASRPTIVVARDEDDSDNGSDGLEYSDDSDVDNGRTVSIDGLRVRTYNSADGPDDFDDDDRNPTSDRRSTAASQYTAGTSAAGPSSFRGIMLSPEGVRTNTVSASASTAAAASVDAAFGIALRSPRLPDSGAADAYGALQQQEARAAAATQAHDVYRAMNESAAQSGRGVQRAGLPPIIQTQQLRPGDSRVMPHQLTQQQQQQPVDGARSPRPSRAMPARSYASEGPPMKTAIQSREVR